MRKTNITDNRVRGAVKSAWLFRIDPDIGETQPSKMPQLDPFFDIYPDWNSTAFDCYVVEYNIVEIEPAVAAFSEITLRIVEVNAVAASVNDKVGEGAVSDGIIAGAADSYALTPAVQYAVGNGNHFAAGMMFGGFSDCPQDKAVIAGADETIADGDSATIVNVDAVVIDHLLVTSNRDSVNIHIFTGGKQDRPARRIDKRYALKQHLAAIEKLPPSAAADAEVWQKTFQAEHWCRRKRARRR